MSRRPFLQKLLNVRPAEWKVVTQLFWLQFFMGTGIAFFFTASFSHFLEKFSASQLAWVMIISSPLLFLTGWVFTKFEHRFHLTRVGTIVIILMAASILIFQLSSNWIKSDWFYYLTFAWYYVLYLASNLCFWSITSTLFDVRQSKRLFAVISGGDIPAKFIGYTMAYFFVHAIGPLNMLWPAFAFMLGALPFLYQLSKSGVVHHHHHMDHVEFVQGRGFKAFVKRYTLNTLIRRLAVLTFIISACLAIINYAFYTEVKEENHDNKNLSNFIILFMAASQIIALLVKIIFTGRIVNSIGIKKSLLITPLVLLGLLIIIISAQFAVSESNLVFYTFGIAAIAVEVLRTTITNPVFLTVMQPLNHNTRSKAHAIVKGIMDPFAFLFAGILLIIINNLKPGNELLTLCYILAFFGISWIVSILLVNRSYHHTLLKAISNRFFSQDEFKLSDEEIQQQILKKIETGNETEIINILQMLNSQISGGSKEIIFKLLDHPSDNIKKVTLLLIQTRNIKGVEEKLKILADHDKNKEIQILAVQSLCKEQNEQHYLKHYLHHHDAGIKAAALIGMLKSNDKENHQYAEDIITDLLRSDHTKDKQTALQVLTEVKDLYCHPHLASLFTTSDRDLRLASFKTIGESATPLLMERVMTYFKEHPLHVGASLQAAGERSIPFILEKISNNDTNSFLKEKLITVLGKIGGHKAQATLFELLEKYPSYSGVIAKSLNRSKYSATEKTKGKLEEISLAYIIYGTELLYMQSLLEHDENYALINSSLNIELIEIRNILICLFGCLYDHEKAFKIKQGLDMKKKESVANAMELIDMIVKKELAIPFNKLYEPADIEYRSNSLKSFLPPDKVSQTHEILSKILEEKPITYNVWTKACSMYISKKTSVAITPGLIEKFIQSEHILLKETALYAQ
jgi:AAA family ATP:ADP antiporter